MSKLTGLVPPLKLCKMIPKGEFEDSMALWIVRKNCDIVDIMCREDYDWSQCENYPAPTLEEILEELRKHQEDVFLKWSPKAYHAWLVNAYTHDKEDYQDHNSSAVTAALTVWLKMKGIEYENSNHQHKA